MAPVLTSVACAIHAPQTFTIRVSGDEETEWEVDKRFSSFVELHAALKAYFPTRRLPALPAKRVIGATEPRFLSRRLDALQEYLRGVCKLRHVGRSEPMIAFLATCDTDEPARTIFKVSHVPPRRSSATPRAGDEERKGHVHDPPTRDQQLDEEADAAGVRAARDAPAATLGAQSRPAPASHGLAV